MTRSIFVDASAMVAVLNEELDGAKFQKAISSADRRITTPMALFETWLAVQSRRPDAAERAEVIVTTWARRMQITTVPLDPETLFLAIDAHLRFGKGRGHPARLNLGDCFSYAAAQHLQLPLLYKGEDFSKTDIPSALG
jgi:ribonuclease VapC